MSTGGGDGRRLVVLAGPTAVGKGTVCQWVRDNHPEVWVSVSATTRAPRPGEVDGSTYHFVDHDEFARLVATDLPIPLAVLAPAGLGLLTVTLLAPDTPIFGKMLVAAVFALAGTALVGRRVDRPPQPRRRAPTWPRSHGRSATPPGWCRGRPA